MEKPGEGDFGDQPVLGPLRADDVREISGAVASMDPWLTLGYTSEAISLYLLRRDPALERQAVTVSGKLSGILTIRFPWLLGPFIELLALFADCRGHGYGRILIGQVCTRYASSPNIWVTVSSFNVGGQKFYSRLGFETVTVIEELIKPGFDEILMRKKLK